MEGRELSERMRQREDQLFLLLTLIIGAIVGLTIVAFIVATERVGLRLYPADGAPWRRFVTPIIGALVTGYFLYRYFPEARGSSIPQTKTALFAGGGYISLRTVIGKFCCSSASLASGIALGREGSLGSYRRRHCIGRCAVGAPPAGEGEVVVACRCGGGISRGVQHSHRGCSFFPRGSHRRLSRATSGIGGPQFGNIMDGAASAAWR
jgi:hypothetical protein